MRGIGSTVHPTPAVRALLAAGIDAATGCEPHRLCPPPEDLAVEEVRRSLAAGAVRERMVPALDRFARRRAWDLEEDIRLLAEISAVTSRILFENLVPILDGLRENGVEVALLKGGDLALHLYPPDLPRAMDDLDLLVRPPDLPVTEAVFRALGYVQGRIDAPRIRILPLAAEEAAAIAATHYELAPFLRIVPVPDLAPWAQDIARLFPGGPNLMVAGEVVYQLLEYDVHFNLSVDFETADLWYGLRRIELAGRELRAQSYADLVWFLAARGYHEVMTLDKPGLRAFIDLLAVVARQGDALDWSRVLAMADKYALHPSLFYCLWHVAEILGPVVPEDLLQACNPANGVVSRYHDWGDLFPRLLGTVAVSPLLAGPAGPEI